MKKFVISFLLLFCISAVAQDRPESVTLGSVLFPPATQFDPVTGRCFGRSINRTREILGQYNIKLNVVCVSAVRIYKMIADGEVDFTINVRSTRALQPNVTFIEKPFSHIRLNLYQYQDRVPMQSVAAIRGFDYAGKRQLLETQNIEFIDQPTSISAILVFIRKRSDALLAYQGPVEYYLQSNELQLDSNVSITPLQKIDSHYAVSNHSPNAIELIKILNDFSDKHLHPNLVTRLE